MKRTTASQVQQGFEAMDRLAWDEAFAAFAAADAGEPLEAQDLEALAWAAYWAGHPGECLAAWERAYGAYVEAGDHLRAAGAALQVARRHALRVQPALARGWRATAARLLADHADAPERGRLLNQEAYALILAGKPEEAKGRANEAYDIGVRSGARDVQATALNLQGQALVRSGKVDEGLRLIDESVAQIAARALDPYDAATLYCWTIGLCRDLADFERARELTETTASWCEEHALTSFPGICRIHRAELFRLHGDLAQAEVEVHSALADLLPRSPFWAARVFNEAGMVKLRMGRLDEAGAAFERAQELGMEAEPGRSMIQMARGQHEAARVQLARTLERRPADLLDRAALLSALAEAAIGSGEMVVAESAVSELEAIAETVGRPAFRAAAAGARGRLLVAEGRPGLALNALRTALEFWIGLNAPYEAARTRLVMGAAYRTEGDEASSRFELELAARAFERMGAGLDRARAEAALGSAAADPLAPLTRRQREVARLVAAGRSNREIATELFLSERTAEYHVQQILNRLGLDSRSQIAAWYARAT